MLMSLNPEVEPGPGPGGGGPQEATRLQLGPEYLGGGPRKCAKFWETFLRMKREPSHGSPFPRCRPWKYLVQLGTGGL